MDRGGASWPGLGSGYVDLRRPLTARPGAASRRYGVAIAGTAQRQGSSPRQRVRRSERARPSLPSSTEDDGAVEGRPFFCDCGLLAASRAVARVPWDPRLHLPRTAPLSIGYLTLTRTLAARPGGSQRLRVRFHHPRHHRRPPGEKSAKKYYRKCFRGRARKRAFGRSSCIRLREAVCGLPRRLAL